MFLPGVYRLAAVMLVAAAVASCGGDAAPDDATVRKATAQLDTLVPQWMARTGVPGVAISVVHEGRTLYARGFGVRQVGSDAPVDADTVFQLASLSKSLAATVMAASMTARVNSSAVDWDTPIQR